MNCNFAIIRRSKYQLFDSESLLISLRSDASSCLVLSVSPTSDEFQLKLGSQLPTCTSCLRRLAYEVSGLCSNNKFWSLWILSNMNRCGVCKAFADYQTGSSSNRIQCQRCIITENIWICLLCGAAGCGRYTLQHAKIHFEETNHPFSLELVSGRYDITLIRYMNQICVILGYGITCKIALHTIQTVCLNI